MHYLHYIRNGDNDKWHNTSSFPPKPALSPSRKSTRAVRKRHIRRSSPSAGRSNGGEAVCHKCGCCDVYNLPKRRTVSVQGLRTQFSVTSGTIFASRKMAFVDLLGAICMFVNAVKGMSALQFARDLCSNTRPHGFWRTNCVRPLPLKPLAKPLTAKSRLMVATLAVMSALRTARKTVLTAA